METKEGFERALSKPEYRFSRDATIFRFTFAYEQAWKIMKRILKSRGIDVTYPKEAFRLSSDQGLIEDAVIWFDFSDLMMKFSARI